MDGPHRSGRCGSLPLSHADDRKVAPNASRYLRKTLWNSYSEGRYDWCCQISNIWR